MVESSRRFISVMKREVPCPSARLEHPHIVPVCEAGLHEGQHYLAMRFMPGGTLAQWAQSHPIEPRRAAGIIRSLAQAVGYAHQHGVLHRVLKPGNVLLDEPPSHVQFAPAGLHSFAAVRL